MTCEQSEQSIMQALDGALTRPERAQLDAHLATCDVCQKARIEYASLAQTADAWARKATNGEQRDDFTERVWACVTERSRTTALRARFGWTLAGTFAVAGVCVALSAILPPVPLHAPDVHQALVSALPTQLDASSWLTGSIGTVSDSLDALARTATRGYALPAWVPGALAGTITLNLALFARVRRQAAS